MQLSEIRDPATRRKYRIRGCLLGLAYGDALATDPQAGSPLRISAVTQLTLFAAEGMLRAWHRSVLKGIDGAEMRIVWESYLRWRSVQQPTYQPPHHLEWPDGQGWLSTVSALHQPSRTGPTTWHELTTRPAFEPGLASNHSLGADPVVRTVPVGLLHYSQPAQVATCAAQLASLTHGHPVAQQAAGWAAATVAYLCQEQPLPVATQLAALHLPAGEAATTVRHALAMSETLLAKLTHPHRTDFDKLMQQRTASASVLAASYYAQRYADQPTEALRRAAECGGRSAAALTGALLGASLGEAGWPSAWRPALDAGRVVVEVADDLWTRCKGSMFECDEQWWRRYPGG